MLDKAFYGCIIILSTGREDEMNANMATNFWMRGIDWCVVRCGRKWRLLDCFGNFPLFNTKKAAYEAATAFVMLKDEEGAN